MVAKSQVVADFRSDTVTEPSSGMIKVIGESLNGRLGDDVIDGDTTIVTLERKAADLCGKEAGLFCASGTMTNQLALTAQLNRLESVICDSRAHVFTSEAGGIAFHSQAQPIPIKLSSLDQSLSVEHIKSAALEGDVHYATTRVVSLENTLWGMIFPDENLLAIARYTRSKGLKLHLDGARLWNAAVAAPMESPEDYFRRFAEPFDSISVCLSKGMGCPIGSVLVGSQELIARCRHLRKSFGGGWRQAGFLAAAGVFAIEHNWKRMVEDHHHAALLASGMQKLGFELSCPVQTNMVWIRDPQKRLLTIAEALAEQGFLIAPSDASSVRIVTHLMIDSNHIRQFLSTVDKTCARC